MSAYKLYQKSITFFSRTKQENIVAKLERRFYDLILIYGTDKKDTEALNLKMQSFSQDLLITLSRYHFEDDLLEHLLNLSHFMENYLTDIQKTQHKDRNVVQTYQSPMRKVDSL